MESNPLLRIAVVGMPGQGKSTLLNGFVKNSTIASQHKGRGKELFESSGSSESCTKEPKHHPLQITTSGGQVPVEVWDTMGWPDTNKLQALNMYDAVVTHVINNDKGLSALVWVVLQSRKNEKIDKLWVTYKPFISELSRVKCPIILLMNGVAGMNGLDDDDFDESDVQKAHEQLICDGKELVERTGVQVFKILTSVSKSNLMQTSPLEIIDLLQLGLVPCRISKLLTFKEIEVAFATPESSLRKHTEDARAKIKDAKQALESYEFLRGCAVAALGTSVANKVDHLKSEQSQAKENLAMLELVLDLEIEKMQGEANIKKADVDRLKEYLESAEEQHPL